MEEEIKRLEGIIEAYESELISLREIESRAEKRWIGAYRIFGTFLFLLAFVPLTVSYIDSHIDRMSIEGADFKLMGLGFFLAWGGKQFGKITNIFGVWLNKKLSI